MDSVNCSPGVSQQAAEVNALNFKALYDDTQSDVSINRKSLMRHQDAWETLRLRNAQFAASFDHALLAGVAIGSQTGNTADQQTISPIRTGLGDTMAGAVYPPNRTIDSATAGEAVANDVALGTALTLLQQAVAALQAVVITAAGGASTPSQTQPKPAA